MPFSPEVLNDAVDATRQKIMRRKCLACKKETGLPLHLGMCCISCRVTQDKKLIDSMFKKWK